MKFAHPAPAVKRGIVGLVALATVIALAGCSTSSGGTASAGKCTVRTLMVSNITGAGSANGSSAQIATKLADDYVNKNGGVNGCKVVTDFKDDGSDYSKVLPLTQAALAAQKYAMVNASDYGGSTVAPLLTRQGILGVFSNGTGGLFSKAKTPTIFDACTPLAGAAVVMSKYLATKGYKKIAIVTDNTAVGSSVIAGAQAAAKKNGVTIIPEQIDLSTVDMTPVVQRTRASDPDVVLVDLFGAPAGYFFQGLTASGWDVPKYGSFTTFATDLASLIPQKDYAGLISGGPASATAPSVTPALSSLITSLKAANNGKIDNALLLYAQNYDTIILFAWAANQTHSTDGLTLAHYLESHGNAKIPGLTQAVSSGYSASNHEWHPANGLGIAYQTTLVNGQYQKRIALVHA